ncbi:TPA: Cro/CI family transcriptional regulator [Aeromonas veronii]
MKKDQAIQFFGSNNAMARAAGVTKSTASEWPEIIPAKHAASIHFASGGQLDFGLDDYRPEQTETQQAA